MWYSILYYFSDVIVKIVMLIIVTQSTQMEFERETLVPANCKARGTADALLNLVTCCC